MYFGIKVKTARHDKESAVFYFLRIFRPNNLTTGIQPSIPPPRLKRWKLNQWHLKSYVSQLIKLCLQGWGKIRLRGLKPPSDKQNCSAIDTTLSSSSLLIRTDVNNTITALLVCFTSKMTQVTAMHYTRWQLVYTKQFPIRHEWLPWTVCVCVRDMWQGRGRGNGRRRLKGKDKEWGSRAGVQDWETMSVDSCNKKMVKYVEAGGHCGRLTRWWCFYLAYILWFFFFLPWEWAEH